MKEEEEKMNAQIETVMKEVDQNNKEIERLYAALQESR